MTARGASWGFERLLGVAIVAIAVLASSAATHAQSADATDQDADQSFSSLGLRGAAFDSNAPTTAQPPNIQPSPSDVPTATPFEASDANAPANANQAANQNPGTPNYGKPAPPVDQTQKYAGRPSVFPHGLPALQPYATAPQLRPHGGPAVNPTDNPAPTVAMPARLPVKKKPIPDPTPFAPVGVDVGTLRLTPYVETDLGYDTNPERAVGGRASPFLRGEFGLSEVSLWNANQLTANFETGYSDYLRARDASRPDGTGKVDLRVDASRQTALDFELRGALSTQNPGSPGVSSSIVGRPLIWTYGATAGVTQTFSRLSLGLHGTIDRSINQDGVTGDGALVQLSTQNYTDYGIQGRAGYLVTPGLVPFVEIDADTRKHDSLVDTSGFNRNSNGIAGLLGTTFQFSGLLTGTLSGGYLQRDYADARLGVVNGPTFNSNLTWAITPLTSFTLSGVTAIGETSVADSAAEVSRTVSLGVTHSLLPNVTLQGLASYQTNAYPGANILEHDIIGTIGVQYALSRSMTLKGTYTHERLLSNIGGASYTADTVLAGVRYTR